MVGPNNALLPTTTPFEPPWAEQILEPNGRITEHAGLPSDPTTGRPTTFYLVTGVEQISYDIFSGLDWWWTFLLTDDWCAPTRSQNDRSLISWLYC